MQNYVRNLHYSNKNLICNNLKKIPLVMRLFILSSLLSIGLAHASSGYAQKAVISLEVKNQTVQEVLDEIEEKSEFTFFFNHKHLNLKRSVSISANQSNVFEILERVFEGTDVNYSVLDKKIVLSTEVKAVAQQDEKRITGTIVDAMGETVPGANIQVKGSSGVGTITDIDGNFSLRVPVNSILVISYIGYETQEVEIANKSQLDILLREDTQALEELVVVGYGVVRKSDLTGSVSRVGMDELKNMPVPSIDKALQGRAAGVQISSTSGTPGAGTSIRIRGGNSISAGNEPLYVIDGFIGGGDLNSINPSDIESIEILKDAAATAIYGSRGANGVIMITTKKGKEGVNKVSASFYQGWQSLPRELPFMEGPERAQFANDYADYNNTSRPFSDLSKVTHTDWQEAVTQTAPVTNADISVSGGNKGFQHYISANYYNQEGIYKSSGFTRYQTRINLDKKITDWLKIGVQTNASSLHTDNPKFSYLNYIKEASTASSIYDEEGNYSYINPIAGTGFDNPVANINLMKSDTYTKRFIGNFYAEVTPVKNLVIRSTVGGDFYSKKIERYNPGSLPVREEQGIGGLARIENSNYISFLNENTATYLWDINEKNRMTVLAGMTVQKEESQSSYTQVEGFSNDLMEFNNLSAGDASTAKYGSGYSANQMLSFLGRVNYSLNNKYLLTVTGRYDGSSRLAANHKWAFFPSAALAWRMSEESFIKDLGLFHNLKLRASYGLIGNQAINVYQSLASLAVTTPTLGGEKGVGYILGNIDNPNLKWETTAQADLGLEASFLKGRLSFEIDYYYKRTKDLLMNVEIPWTSGYNTQLQNVGEVKNQGVELMVNATLLDTKDWHWSVNMNISKNQNKVLDINGAEYLDLANGVRLYKDQPAAVFVGAVYDGTWKSQEEIDANPTYMPGVRPGCAKFKDVNCNGKYDGVKDYEILGSPEADFFGGFGTTVDYKGLTLELFFQGTYGNEILNTGAASMFFGSFGSNLYNFPEAPWSEDNPTSNMPAAGSFNYGVDVNTLNYSVNVQDGSFLKLKTLKLAYNLPRKTIPFAQNLNLYLLFNNLFTITNYDWGYDPDVTGNGAVVRGVDNMAYPQNRSVQVGFNVEF